MELTHNLPGPGQVDVPILLQHVTRVLLQAGVVIDTCSPDLVTRVDIGGSYGEHQCGIVLHNISRDDAGNWTCEVKMFCIIYSSDVRIFVSNSCQNPSKSSTTS